MHEVDYFFEITSTVLEPEREPVKNRGGIGQRDQEDKDDEKNERKDDVKG